MNAEYRELMALVRCIRSHNDRGQFNDIIDSLILRIGEVRIDAVLAQRREERAAMKPGEIIWLLGRAA